MIPVGQFIIIGEHEDATPPKDLLPIRVVPSLYPVGWDAYTQALLLRLPTVIKKGMTLLDMIPGPGIVALAAARLGATSTVLLEHEGEVAKNAKLNNVTVKAITLSEDSGPYDIVVGFGAGEWFPNLTTVGGTSFIHLEPKSELEWFSQPGYVLLDVTPIPPLVMATLRREK